VTVDADVAKVHGIALEKDRREAEAIPLLEQALAWDSRDAREMGLRLCRTVPHPDRRVGSRRSPGP
jgi:hypothetical protein